MYLIQTMLNSIRKMFQAAFDFLDIYDNSHNKLIHCNQGESRGPSIAMLYLAHIGYFKSLSYHEAREIFNKLYPIYNPRNNIFKNVVSLWNYFCITLILMLFIASFTFLIT